MEYTSTYKDEEGIAKVQISEEVLAVIAGIAATEVKGVVSLAGNVASELISRIGIKLLSRGIKITLDENIASICLTLNIDSNYQIQDVSRQVQERVVNAIESMTGLKVVKVDIVVEHVTIHKS